MKCFNQEFVIRFENPSVYEFRQRGHHCLCEKCYEKKGDMGILASSTVLKGYLLKWVVFRAEFEKPTNSLGGFFEN